MRRFLVFVLILAACSDGEQLDVKPNQGENSEIHSSDNSDGLTQIKDVALSFHQWNIRAILDESNSMEFDFDVVQSEDGKCQIDSTDYFSNLRNLGTVSEKFIQSEWDRVSECSDFLSTLDWETYQNADAYEFQDDCGFFYHHYWTRTQEPFHGVEVKEVKQEGDFYLVTLVFFHQYDEKLYSDGSSPIVKVEEENGEWRITNISWG